MDSSYTNFWIINSAKKSVVRKFAKACLIYLEKNNINYDAISKTTDQKLFQLSKTEYSSPDPLACLRCRVTHGIYKQINYLFTKHKKQYEELDLFSMLICVLDDNGENNFKIKKDDKGKKFIKKVFTWENICQTKRNLLPSSTKIILNFNDSKSSVTSWIANQVKSNHLLKSYFRSVGLLLLSPWALINNTSSKRVKMAWLSYGENVMTVEQVEALHKSFCINYQKSKLTYKKTSGRIIGWEPNRDFLNSLVPKQNSFKNLFLIDDAIRQYMSPSKTLKNFLPYEDELSTEVKNYEVESNYDSNNISLIKKTIREVGRYVINEKFKEEKKKWDKDPNRKLCLQLYTEGLSQRKIAERCGHKQGWVSKLIQENILINKIISQTALNLKNYPDFKNLKKDPKILDEFLFLLRENIQSEENLLLKTLFKELIQE